MNSNTCQLEEHDGCSIISLLSQANDLEWAEIESIGNNVVSSINSNETPSVLVDLTKMDYIGSSMVALIVRIWKTVDGKQGKMVVANKHDLVYEVLKLAGLTKVWTFSQSREEGMQQLGASKKVTTGSLGLMLLGVLLTCGALCGLGILLSGSEVISDKIAMILTFVCAALGIITGTLIFAKSSSIKKIIGALVVLTSIAIAIVGVMKFPVTQIMAPPPVPEENKKTGNNLKEDLNKDTKTEETLKTESPKEKSPKEKSPKEKK